MGKAFEAGLTIISFKNQRATTSIVAYTPVRLCTTEGSVQIITTKGTIKPVGIAQENIPPLTYGKIAMLNCGGISRVKMASTAYTTINLSTSNLLIGVTAGSAATGGSRANRITTSTYYCIGEPLTTWAASDIIPVALLKQMKGIIAGA